MANKNPHKSQPAKDQLVCVGEEHKPLLEELSQTYGTYKNVVGKALELLAKADVEASSAAGH